jgi:hypothetical protein
MKKAVISMAAGVNQLLIIQKAKKLGFAIIGVDKNPDAMGFAECDEKIYLSTHDAVPVVEQLKHFTDKYDIKGVLNRSSGRPAVTTAEICKFLNLPNIEPDIAKIIIDKSLLMNFCHENKIQAPWNISIR